MEPGPIERRRRPAVVCSECRRRKIRCDRGFPCGPCRKSMPMLSCIYHSQPAGHAAAAPLYTRTAQQHHARPKGSTHSLDLSRANVPTFGEDAFAGLDHIGLEWPPNWPHSVGSSVEHLTDVAPDYFHGQSFSGHNHYDQTGTHASRMEQRCPGSADATSPSSAHFSMGASSRYSDDGWYETLARVKEIRPLVHRIRKSQEHINGPLAPPLPRECPEDDDGLRLPPLVDIVMKLEHSVRLQREQSDRQSLTRLSPLLKSSSRIQRLLPPRQACKKLVGAYFATFGSVLCILDTTNFFNDLERFWEETDTSQSPATDREEAFAHKLLVVVALGSVACSGSFGNAEAERTRQTCRRSHAVVCVQRTRQWLAQKTERGVRADLDIAQILCLLALARHTQLHADPWPRRPSIDGTVILTGDHDLARLGMQMGLHREPRASPPLGRPAGQAETERRRRLWTTMLEISLHQYLDAELPPPLNADSYDSAAPSSTGLQNDPRSYLAPDCQRTPGSAVLAALSRTQRLRLKILQQLHAPGAVMTAHESQRLAAELNKACNVEMNNLLLPGATRPTSFQLWLFNALARPFVLALNVPCGGAAENTFGSYYCRRMRMETAVRMLRAGPQDGGLDPASAQTPIHSGHSGLRSRAAAATHLFLPTPSSAASCSGSGAQQEGMYKAACTALCVGGSSHCATVHRQVVAMLYADLIAEIRDDLFPSLDAAMLQSVMAVLEDVVDAFRTQVRTSGGIHACREFILFAVAHSLSVALLNRSSAREVNDSIMSALWRALHHCCKAMGEQAEGLVETDWELGAIEAATEPRPVVGGLADEEDGETDTRMQMVDFVLEPQDDFQRVQGTAADAEVAEMWAFDDDESYFSVGV